MNERVKYNELRDKIIRIANYGKESILNSSSYEKIKDNPDHLYNVENFDEEVKEFMRKTYLPKGSFDDEIKEYEEEYVSQDNLYSKTEQLVYELYGVIDNIYDKTYKKMSKAKLNELLVLLKMYLEEDSEC